jgi:hypothetical protein
MTQLERLVASMTDAGYQFVTVSELLAASVKASAGRTDAAR